MKYRSIKTPPAAGNISVQDAVKSAKAVARSVVTDQFVRPKRTNGRTVIVSKVARTSPRPKILKSTGNKKSASTTLSKSKVKSAAAR